MAARRATPPETPVRVVLVTLDRHLAGAAERASARLAKRAPGVSLTFHAAADWGDGDDDNDARARARADVARADVVIASMLFMESHIAPIKDALEARAGACDAIVGCLSASEIVKLTRLGAFRMDKPESGAIALLKKLRGSSPAQSDKQGDKAKAGARQAKMLRRLPKILKYVPGTAQDVRAYFLTLQYLLAGSAENLENLVLYLLNRYAAGPRAQLRGAFEPAPPADYPEVGCYHPRMAPKIGEAASKLPLARSNRPNVGLLLMRSYLIADDARHYDGVIAAMEAKGLRVTPVFASGLDARPAIDRYFHKNGQPSVDAVVSLTGFSLVGGPAYNEAGAAAAALSKLDVPYVCAQALEFQSLEAWREGSRGLTPVEATMMVSIPELDGATGPIVFAGRGSNESAGDRTMSACPERAETLAARIAKLVDLRRKRPAERKVAIALFNFPPNGGAVGSAAGLSVYESLLNALRGLAADGYDVDAPADVDALRAAILDTDGAPRLAARIAADDWVRAEPRLAEIEAQWGPAPGRVDADARSIRIHGAHFGSVFVGIQPAFGYEGDPMRLLFEGSFAPTHAFAAFHHYVRRVFDADAILHFGTHGALEFMPGKQVGLTGDCWPDYLIGDLPNFYFYACNNPSEAALAKRRAAATTISYLSPPLARADLYKDLADLNATIDRWRTTAPDELDARADVADLIQVQAAALDMGGAAPAWGVDAETEIMRLRTTVRELEDTLIPHGLHIAGDGLDVRERADMLDAMALDWPDGVSADARRRAIDAVVAGASARAAAAGDPALEAALAPLVDVNEKLSVDAEIPALLRALDGGFVAPVAGGDVARNPDVLPTGRNIHGFDPFRLPSAYALADGARQAERLLARRQADAGALPETVAIVLWGTDNLKSEGAQVAQAMALLGARPRFDSYGRLGGAELIPLSELGRPRIDVVATLSGIFRDLLPLQTRMLAEAAYAAASAEEDPSSNFVRKHALAYQAQHGCDFETAALRVFSNADGAYGANVNQLIDAGLWNDEDELADAFEKRKCYAYGRTGDPAREPALLSSILGDVDVAYQNLESVELGVTTIDHYFDTLGGVGRAVRRAKGDDAAVYIGDQTRGPGVVRTLKEQVAIETRTRALNPKWYEGLLSHGYEGVRQIEAPVTNTMGWSATTGMVDPWVYQKLSETYVLDEALRDRLAALNPKACARVANRLIEACERDYWRPDDETLLALRAAGEDLEDRLEGVAPAAAGAAV
ncbi:MAG: magnesium chelatase subunit H [Parvularculaceae bacterium]